MRGGAGCSGEKWKGIKLNRGPSHIPGGGRLPRPAWGGSRGRRPQAPRGPGTAGLTPRPGACEAVGSPWSPGWRGRRPRSYLGPPRAPSLPHIRGGCARGGGGLGQPELASLSQHPEEGRALASLPHLPPPAPKEQRSAAALDQSPRRSSPWQLQHQGGRPAAPSPQSHPPEESAARVRGLPASRPVLAGAGNLEILLLKCTRCPEPARTLLSRVASLPLAQRQAGAGCTGWRPGVRPTDATAGAASEGPGALASRFPSGSLDLCYCKMGS